MSRLHLLSAACLAAALIAPAPVRASTAAPPLARGLLVQLKTPEGARETPQAARDRAAALATAIGVPDRAPSAVGQRHHLMRFERPLSGDALAAAVRRARLNPEVESAEPDVRVKRQAEPNDPFYAAGQQWYLKTPALGGAAALNLPPAWDRSTGSPTVTVAVVDTGVLFTHPDLAPRLLPGYDMVSDVGSSGDGDGRDPDPSDPGDWVSAADLRNIGSLAGCTIEDSSWHGTAIAGLIGASTNNATGVAGVDWRARILPVRVSSKCGAWISDVVDGLRWAAGLAVAGAPLNPNRARIINLSIGSGGSCTSAYQSAINEVTAAGSLVVTAAGNDNGPLMRPADCVGALSVGAVRQDGLKTYYSNFGADTDIMAPGGAGLGDVGPGLYATANSGKQGPVTPIYDRRDGTSFAAPLVSGVAALMLALNPALTPAELTARISAAARPFPNDPAYPVCSTARATTGACNCTRDTCGPGLLDADRALQLAIGPAVTIAPVAPVAVGSSVVLDGRGSAATPGAAIVSYQWSQTSGTPLTIQNPQSPVASVRPMVNGTWVFRLLVADSAGRSSDNFITVVAGTGAETAPPTPGGGSTATDGAGGGAGGGAFALRWGAGLWLLAVAAWGVRRQQRAPR